MSSTQVIALESINVKGVEFTTPPLDKIGIINQAVKDAFKQLPSGAKGGLFAIVNEQGANAVLATKTRGDVEILAYIGRHWNGSINYGVAVRRVW
jgi:hypothetical protein